MPNALTPAIVLAAFGQMIAAGIRNVPGPLTCEPPEIRKRARMSAAETWVRQLPGWTDVDLQRAIDAYSDTEFGGMWPTTADLKKCSPPSNSATDAWAMLRGHLTGAIPTTVMKQLTVYERWAIESLPNTFARRQMSGSELDRLRAGFLEDCRDFEQRARERAVLEAVPQNQIPEALPIDRQRAAEFTRQVFAYKPIGAVRASNPSERRNEQGGPKAVTPAPLRAPVNEAELRERAERQADAIRARVAK
jgi:hypothetical protein